MTESEPHVALRGYFQRPMGVAWGQTVIGITSLEVHCIMYMYDILATSAFLNINRIDILYYFLKGVGYTLSSLLIVLVQDCVCM